MSDENLIPSQLAHAQEAEQLRRRIGDLLKQVEALREVTKDKDSLEDLVVKLRDANQNLVIAAIGAQGLQAAAEAVNHKQEAFLSMLAHELRNPLAPVAMAAELLGKILDAHPQLPKLHAVISRQVRHLIRLVDDLLDASRFSSGKIDLHRQSLYLREIIESAVETSQPFIDKRNQQLSIDLPTEPIPINGDPVRLAQVFSNLLINAAKFTPEFERIAVSANRSAGMVTVSVKDNGMGVALDIQPFIFDLFTQGFHTLDRSQGGLGIGLSLVRTVVESHGGNVKVHSAGAGMGSEFIVQLPLSTDIRPSQKQLLPTAASRVGLRILLIEDNSDAIETLSDLLVREGHTTRSASNGQSGLDTAAAEVFDIVICDIGLPGMDGYDVARQLRLDAQQVSPTLIALTGYGQSADRNRAIEAGFDHYLVKPVAIDELLNIISTIKRR